MREVMRSSASCTAFSNRALSTAVLVVLAAYVAASVSASETPSTSHGAFGTVVTSLPVAH